MEAGHPFLMLQDGNHFGRDLESTALNLVFEMSPSRYLCSVKMFIAWLDNNSPRYFVLIDGFRTSLTSGAVSIFFSYGEDVIARLPGKLSSCPRNQSSKHWSHFQLNF